MRERVGAYLPELVLLANAGAFGVLLVELLILEHWDGIQRVAPVTAAAGAVLCGVALVLPGRLRAVPAVLLLVLSGAGLLGFVRHMDERDGGFPVGVVAADDDDDSSGRGSGRDDDDDDDDEPPPLAPLGLTGTAALSGVAAFAGKRDEA